MRGLALHGFLGCIACGVLFSGRCAHAEFIVDIDQVGSNVVMTGSGTLNVSALTLLTTDGLSPSFVEQSENAVVVGPSTSEQVDEYHSSSVLGPSSLGSGPSDIRASSGTGDMVGLFIRTIFVPHGYTGGALSDTATYDNATFASLGLGPGTYVYNWGSVADSDADSFTINIGTASVPTPRAAWAGTVLLGLVGISSLRKRPMAE